MSFSSVDFFYELIKVIFRLSAVKNFFREFHRGQSSYEMKNLQIGNFYVKSVRGVKSMLKILHLGHPSSI